MRKIGIILGVSVALAACGGYSDEQGKAAEEMCKCMDANTHNDFDINWYECELAINAAYSPEIFEDDSWVEALEEKCPAIAEKLED